MASSCASFLGAEVRYASNFRSTDLLSVCGLDYALAIIKIKGLDNFDFRLSPSSLYTFQNILNVFTITILCIPKTSGTLGWSTEKEPDHNMVTLSFLAWLGVATALARFVQYLIEDVSKSYKFLLRTYIGRYSFINTKERSFLSKKAILKGDTKTDKAENVCSILY